MEQHPVPQHIASFEFKLFGNLTIRQFITLAIPAGFAALIFFSNIPVIIRLPFSLIFLVLGLFAALVPVGGRPFDKWVVAFIHAILSPTQRVWVKEPKIPEFLAIITSLPTAARPGPQPITATDRSRLTAFLKQLPKGPLSEFDVKEKVALAKLNLQIPVEGQAQLPPAIVWPTAQSASLPQITPLGITAVSQDQLTPAITPIAPKVSPHAKPFILPGIEKKLKGEAEATTAHFQLASDVNSYFESVIPIRTPGRKIKLVHGVGRTRARKLHFAPPEGFDLSKLPIRGERRFEVSEELKRRFTPLAFDAVQNQPQIPAPGSQTATTKTSLSPKPANFAPKQRFNHQTAANVSLKPQTKEDLRARIAITDKKTAAASEISSRAQIVPLTNRPNVLSGLISTADGTPVESAILTVRDQNGIPVRALKTNKLGQFLSATPLSAGKYQIEIESEAANFEPFSVTLNDDVLSPLDIKAKGGANG